MSIRPNVSQFAAIVVLLAIITAWHLVGGSELFGQQASFTLLIGAAFGILLQRSRFCFFCILRDLFEFKDGRPAAGILTALAIGSVGYLVLFGSWITDPSAGYLPQDAHIGPVSWHLLLGGLLFGWGMALSGSCISAHLYRLGEGSAVAPFALGGAVVGFIMGFRSWNTLYVATISDAPVVWLPQYGGYALWAVIQLAVLLGLLVWLVVRTPPLSSAVQSAAYPAGQDTASHTTRTASSPAVQNDRSGCASEPVSTAAEDAVNSPTFAPIWQRVFVERWPTWIGGIGVGFLSFIAYFRVEPLGVTAELGRKSRELGTRLDVIPGRLEGLDQLAGCSTATSPELLTSNGIFVTALVVGSLFTALLSGRFRLSKLTFPKAGKGFLGGIFLGFGAMISLGCTIGTTLSGISAFAVSGWVFTVAMVLGVWSGIRWKWHK